MKFSRLVLVAVLAGCPAPGGKVDPATAKVDDLVGYWHHWSAGNDAQSTVFGFVSAADAPWELPLTENALDAGGLPASIVYLGSTHLQLAAGQIATFGVSGGAIQQTVLGDRNALPGTKFETQIYELTPRQSLVLESKNDPSGRRTWQWFERCQVPNAAGWSTFNTTQCFADFSVGTAMVFDRFGDLHAVSGRGARSKPCDVPTFADVTRACVPRITEAPNLKNASLAVGPDDVLRMAWVDSENQLHVRERPLRGDTWTDTVIDPLPGTTGELKLYDDAQGRLLVLVTEVDSPSLFRWDGARWNKSVATMTGGAPFPTQVTSLARAPDGTLVFGLRQAPWVLREAAGGFEAWPLPDVGPRGPMTVTVDSRGRLHAVLPGADVGTSAGGVGGVVVGAQGDFGILEDGQWRRWKLPIFSGAWLAPKADGTGRLMVALEKAVYPSFALLTVEGDTLAQELVHADTPTGLNGSTLSHAHVTVEAGPDGALAATLDGQQLWVRGPSGPVQPRSSVLQLTFAGKTGARVLSTDGKVDCSTDCEVSYPAGSRVELRLETQPGHVATLACPEMRLLGAERCVVSVREPQTQVPTTVVRTAVRDLQQAGPVNGAAVGQRFGRLGSRTAFGTALNPGATFAVDGVELPLANPSAAFGVAVFDSVTRSGWHSELPVEALAVAPAADGGAFAVVRVSAVTPFGAVMVGTAGQVTLARLRLSPAGQVLESVALLTAPAATVQKLANQPSALVGSDGTAAVVVTSTAGFTAQGLTELTAVATVNSAGASQLLAVDASEASAAVVALEGGQVFVGASVAGGARLVAFDAQGQRQGTRLVADARAQSVSARPGRRGVLLTSSGAALDLGGGPRTGAAVLGEFDTALSHVASASTPAAGVPRGFALLPDGGAVLFDFQTAWRLDAALGPVGGGDPLALNGAQLFMAAQTELGLGVALYLPQPVAPNGLRTVSGPVLLELVPPR